MKNIYPYSAKLDMYESLSFSDKQMGSTLSKASAFTNYEKGGPNDDFNLTVDIAYELLVKESTHVNHHRVQKIPILIKTTVEDVGDENTCHIRHHGLWNAAQGLCSYY